MPICFVYTITNLTPTESDGQPVTDWPSALANLELFTSDTTLFNQSGSVMGTTPGQAGGLIATIATGGAGLPMLNTTTTVDANGKPLDGIARVMTCGTTHPDGVTPTTTEGGE